MRRKKWKTRKSIEADYRKALSELDKFIAKRAAKAPDIPSILALLQSITEEKSFKDWAQNVAAKMVQSAMASNAKTWREAAAKSQQGAKIHAALKAEFNNHSRINELIHQNASMIKSLPNKIANEVSREASRLVLEGARATELKKIILAKMPNLSESRAGLIARTETAKASSAITEIRSQSIGVNHYLWRTSEDGRVRSSHAHMNGVICSFTNPPSPEALNGQKSAGAYGAGGIYNCRCYAEPITDIDFVSFPAKAVVNGRIQRVTRKQLVQILAEK